MVSTIGIKIANGEFYSILEENSRVKKRLILTTVHDKQQSVQIDLYKSYTRTMADALYVGSLVVDNIKARPRGEPSIELIISSTPGGEIIADAVDLDTSAKGEHQTLNVSLKSLDDDNREFEIPDFELEHNQSPPAGLYEETTEAEEKESRKFPWLVVICIALILTAIALAVWLFLFRDGKSGEPAPVTTAESSAVPAPPKTPAHPPAPVVQSPPAVPAPQPPAAQPSPSAAAESAAEPLPPAPQAPPPVIRAPESPPPAAAPVNRKRPAPPVASYKVPTVIPKGGAPYRIRWGDTLWDISEAFYRNPWLYPRIARFNNIRNPDLIISGRTIRIPPRN